MNLILRNRNFKLLWLSQLISNIGDWLNSLALPLLVLKLTNSPIAISFYMILRFVPTLLLSSFTGVLIDKFDRKKMMIISDITRMIIYFTFIFATNAYQVYTLAFLASIMTLIFEPAKNAMIPNIVSQDELLEANSISSSTASLMRVIGTVTGGLLLALLGIKITFIINSTTFLISVLLISFVNNIEKKEKVSEQQKSEEKNEINFARQVKVSYKAIWGDKTLFTLITMDAISIIGYGGLNVLLPIFTTKVLTNFEGTYGLIMSVFSMGIFIGSIQMKRISAKRSLPVLWCFGLTLSGLTQIFMGISYSTVLAAIFIFITGFGDALQIVSYSTIRQRIVPDYLRGRVFSIAEGVNSGALILGIGATGLFLNFYDSRILVIISGILIFSSGLISFIVFNKLLFKEERLEALKEK